MDSEGKFWFSVMSALFAAVTIILVSLMLNDAYAASKVAEIINHGADPATARCAIYGSSERGLDCNLVLLPSAKRGSP